MTHNTLLIAGYFLRVFKLA